MQHGCMERLNRKRGPQVWQFRWSETDPHGKRLYHKKIVGTVEQYPDETAVRRAVVGLLSEINADVRTTGPRAITIAQLCDHFEQRELSKENTWRSHATKKIYKAYLTRWVRPHWHRCELSEVRTIQVESWLRRLPLAKSSCAKIPNLMSFFLITPADTSCSTAILYLVRQSAKRRRVPVVLMPSEIKALVDKLSIRERTLVLLAVSTGLRQSELFGLKWGDIDFAEGHMHVTRSIVYGVVGPCKTEASQKPVPIHSILAEALLQWRKGVRYSKRRRLGFRKQAPRGPKTVLGPGDLTQIHSPCGTECRNPEVIRMAHVPAHVLDSATKCRNRIQGDARTAPTFDLALNVGRLHSGDNSGEACSSSSGRVAGLSFRCAWRTASCHLAAQKRAQKGRETRPFRALDGFLQIRLTLLEGMAGTTRLELATSAVTGQRSNQLNYVPAEGNAVLRTDGGHCPI